VSNLERKTLQADIFVGAKPLMVLFAITATLILIYFEPNPKKEVDLILHDLVSPGTVFATWLATLILLGIGSFPNFKQVTVASIGFVISACILFGSVYLFGAWGFLVWFIITVFAMDLLDSVYPKGVRRDVK
jgi:hypothetical protein